MLFRSVIPFLSGETEDFPSSQLYLFLILLSAQAIVASPVNELPYGSNCISGSCWEGNEAGFCFGGDQQDLLGNGCLMRRSL